MVLKCYSNGIQCFHMFFYTLYFFFKIPFKEIPKGVATLLVTIDYLWNSFGPFSVDLFANRENNKIDCFISPFPDPLSSGVNALSLHWDEWSSLYLYPPTPLLGEVVARLQNYQGKGILIAPYYALSGWFPQLLARCPDHLALPEDHSLSQMTIQGLLFHQNPSLFRLHVWIL